MKSKRLTRSESQQLTRARLIGAAERVFVRAGFDAASVEQIAAEAGFSRGAFYSNFPNKDTIFLELLDRKRLETQDALDVIFREAQDPGERFRAARDWYANRCDDRKWATLRTEFRLRALRSPPIRKRLSAILQQELEAYAALIRQYFSEAGESPPERPETLALSLISVFEGLAMLSLISADAVTEQSLREIRDLAFDRLLMSPSGKGWGAKLGR